MGLNPKPDCILTMSGGIDSTVLAHKLVDEGHKPLGVYIDYGSKASVPEIVAARKTAHRLGIPFVVIDFTLYKHLSESYILGNTDKFEKGSMFWLEGRNLLIGTILAVLAAKHDIGSVYIGVNAGDNEGNLYPDTGLPALHALNDMIDAGFKKKVAVYAPWLEFGVEKPAIIALGNKYGVDWVNETHSCSSSGDKPCCKYDECESCADRLHDFGVLGLPDPFAKAENASQ